MVFAPNERGQGILEYGLIIVLIAVLLLASLGLITLGLSTIYSRIASGIPIN